MSGLIQVHRLYSVDLYDTTVEYQDVRISDELIKSQLMWPDIAVNQTDSSSEDKEKYVNPKVCNIIVLFVISSILTYVQQPSKLRPKC